MIANLFSIVLFRINLFVLPLFLILSIYGNTQGSFNFSDSTFAVGDVRIVRNIHFNMNNQDLIVDKVSKPVLDSLVLFLNSHKKISFEVGVHTGVRGNAEANLKIGEFRAHSLRYYLISKGVSERQLIAKSYGETDPINLSAEINCFTESEKEKQAKLHSQNQRIVLMILSMD